MALIPVLHVVAADLPVDPTTNPSLLQGKVVKLNTSGYVIVTGTDDALAIGIAGDNTVENTSPTPNVSGDAYARALIINGAGAKRSTDNRVSDFFDQTLASGYITVYMGGGIFKTDQVDSGLQTGTSISNGAPGTSIGCTSTGTLKVYNAGAVVGSVIAAYGAEESGVPGVDINGSTTLGNYITFKLSL